MKKKFLVPMLVLLAFGALLFFSGNSALAMDESTDPAIVEADQSAHEGDDQVVQEEVPVEEDLNKVESDHEAQKLEEEQNLGSKDENQVQEDEVTTGSDNENNATAEEPVVEDGSQPNHPEGEPSTGSEPAEQPVPDTEN